jgi:hypothetical protein
MSEECNYHPHLPAGAKFQPQSKTAFECLMGYKGDRAMMSGWFIPDWLADVWIENNNGVVPDDLEQAKLDEDTILWRVKEKQQ